MTSGNLEILKKIEASLELLLLGRGSAPIQDISDTAELNRVVELTNMLSGNFTEMEGFARNLAKGNLDIDIPGRRNYLAAPLKELHSQLSSFIWIVQQLQKGRIVDKLDYVGEISTALNQLIEKVANQNDALRCADDPEAEAESSLISWKYHQVLMAFNHLHQMVLVVDKDGRVVFSNHPASSRFGELSHLRTIDLPEDTSVLIQTLAALSSVANSFPAYHEIYDEPSNCWYKITSDQIQFPDGSPIFLHSIEDVSEWKSNETMLKISATTDHLTGVYNRNMGMQALAAVLQNKSYMVSSAAFIDMDGLKYINDTFGHNEGDFAIKSISEALFTSVRDSDTVSRFGGDEFLIVFSGCRMEVAEKVISRVYEKIHAINDSHIKPYTLAFSYGITQIDEKCTSTAQDLIILMDKKMYERKTAKKAGRK